MQRWYLAIVGHQETIAHEVSCICGMETEQFVNINDDLFWLLHSDNSSAGSSSSATTNRVLTVNSSCQRLVDVFYGTSKTLYCIGT